MLTDADRIPQPPDGKLLDYVLEEYPPNAPREGLHSVSILRHFLRIHGWYDAFWPVMERLREVLGPDQTVWGIKDRPGIELYFYNHGSRDHMAVGKLVDALADLVPMDSRVDPDQPYLMCSLELDQSTIDNGRAEGFRIYVAGRPQDIAPDGTSYLVDGDQLLMENLYWFYRPHDLRRVIAHLKRSVHARPRLKQLLRREYLDCYTVCFANKRFTDALYFSRIDTDTAVDFLKEHWPSPTAEVMAAHAVELQHLRWDVGYDFQLGPGVVKVGIYGFY